jgi:hypothetical protein
MRSAIFPADRQNISPPSVFSNAAFPGHKRRVHLLIAPGGHAIWVLTHTDTMQAQRCLTVGHQMGTDMSNVAKL